MLMPKAPMDKDYLATARKYDVGGARQLTRVKAVSISERTQYFPNSQLWPCIALLISAHDRGNRL